jgi:hypothetical protein
VVEQPESRSLVSVGIEWATRVTTIGLEFAVPVALGYGLDHWLRTAPAATIVGAVLGFAAGMLHTLRLASEVPGGARRGAQAPRNDRDLRAPGSAGHS